MEKSDDNQLNREQDTPQSFYWKKIVNKQKRHYILLFSNYTLSC